MLERVHLQELLRLQVAFLGQGLYFALEACIAPHHVHLQIHPELFLGTELVELGRETVDFRIGIFLAKATRVVAAWDGDIDCGGSPVGKAGEVQRASVR